MQRLKEKALRLSPAWILVPCVFAVYWPSLQAQFHPVDDWQYVTANPYVAYPSWQTLTAAFSEVLKPSTVMGYYQPLTMASLMLDRAIQLTMSSDAGISPFIFHFTNVLIHALNSVLVFAVVRRVSGQSAAPILCGLIFAISPLNVECVTWISQRKALLSTFFVLIAVLSHIRFADEKRWFWYCVTVISFIAGVLSKPTGLFLPLVLLLLDVWPLRRFSLKCVLEQVPNFVIAGLAAWIAHKSQLTYFEHKQWDRYWSAYQTLLIGCHSLIFYISKTFVPTGLFPEYILANESEISLATPAFIAGLAGTSALAAGFVRAVWRRDLPVWTMMASYVLLLAPTLTPLKYQESIAADRFAYMPMVFLLILTAVLIGGWLERPGARAHLSGNGRRVMSVICAALVLILVWPNLLQQQLRRDALSYYTAIAGRFPDSRRGHFCMGRALVIEEERIEGSDDVSKSRKTATLQRAAEEFKKVIELESEFSPAYYALSEVLFRHGRPDEAIAVIKQGMNQPGAGTDGIWILGAAYSNVGRYAEAVDAYVAYLKHQPLYAPARKNLANALLRLGRAEESLQHYQLLYAIDPRDGDALQNWGVALITVGQIDQAVERLREVVGRRRFAEKAHPGEEARGKLADAEYTLAGALAIKGRISEALALLDTAIRAKPALKQDYLQNPAFATIRQAQMSTTTLPGN